MNKKTEVVDWPYDLSDASLKVIAEMFKKSSQKRSEVKTEGDV